MKHFLTTLDSQGAGFSTAVAVAGTAINYWLGDSTTWCKLSWCL